MRLQCHDLGHTARYWLILGPYHALCDYGAYGLSQQTLWYCTGSMVRAPHPPHTMHTPEKMSVLLNFLNMLVELS